MKEVQKRIAELQDFFDFWDRILLLGLGVIFGIPFLPAVVSIAGRSFSTPQYPLSPVAAFTALYVFFAFKTMRHNNAANSANETVRRDYNEEKESDFGLRNFGPGPALYLRVHATVEPNGPEHTIEEADPPLHLTEGEFISVLKDDLAELCEENSSIYQEQNCSRLELYYTWESSTGNQCPPGLNGPREMTIDELKDAADDPRYEELENLRENCAQGPAKVEEPPV